MKIIIIGAGISGLTTYLFLRKHLLDDGKASDQHDIRIYEAYDIHKLSWNPDATTTATARSSAATPDEPTKDLQKAGEPIFTPQAIGSAIGISRNGLNVLSRLDETDGQGVHSSLVREMSVKGHPIERWEIGSARGFTIIDVSLVPRDQAGPSVSKQQQQQQQRKTKRPELTGEDRFMYHGIMIARQACWEIMRDRLLQVAEIQRRRVAEVRISGDGSGRNVVVFEDGGEEEADLVIGADGLRSVVRKAMFAAGEAGTATGTSTGAVTGTNTGTGTGAAGHGEAERSWLARYLAWLLPLSFFKPAAVKKPDYVTPHYEGLVGLGGFVPSSVLQSKKHQPGTMSILFGSNGFFGHGYITSTPASDEGAKSTDADPDTTDSNSNTTPARSPQWVPAVADPGPLSAWWSTFSCPTPFPFALPSSPESTKPYSFDKTRALESLLARHAHWKNPAVHAILEFVKQDTEQLGVRGKGLDASYPTWTTPELPCWTRPGVVLVGDAAHALQPSSGQGACQAMEDAESLALCLKHALAAGVGVDAGEPEANSNTVATALRWYETLRMPRLHEIYVRSQRMSGMKSDMNIVMEYMMYGILYATRWFKDDFNDKLMKYDVPAEVERVVKRG